MTAQVPKVSEAQQIQLTLSAITEAAPTHSKAAQALCDGYCTLVALGVTRDAALQLGVRMDACHAIERWR